MKFSLITITFNAQKYLAETLESVAAQTYADYEHIIWDGGSSDRTLEIALSFPHTKLYQGRDKGIADAMNLGASLADGDYLIHLHADDTLAHPNALEHIATSLHQHPHTQWLYGRAHIIDEEGELISTTPFEPYSSKRLRKYNFITHPATVISRPLFERVGGFRPQLRYCMDYDLWLRLASLAQPFVFPSVLACFREHQNSLSTSEPLHVTDEVYRVRNQYVNSLWERYRSYRTWKKRRKFFLKGAE